MTLLLCLSLVMIHPVFAAGGSSSGTVHVASPAPSVSGAELWDSGETTDDNNTASTVDTEYHINFTVADTNSLANLDNVTIVIWESGTSSEVDSDAESNHYTFTWIESTDTWASSPSGFVTSANCNDPGTGSVETSYEFTLAFDLSKVAKYNSTSTAWKIKIYAFDDEVGSDSDGTLMFGVALYSEISISDTTHGWTSLDPGATDEQIDSPGDSDIDFTIVANDNWTIQAKGSGDLISGANAITLSNVKIHKDTLGSAVSLTTSYVDVGGLVNQTWPTSESGIAIFCTLWPNVPTGTLPGDYTYTLYLQIVQQT